MRLDEVLADLAPRWRSPRAWVSLAAFGGLFGSMVIWELHGAGLHGPRAWVAGATAPVVSAAGHAFLSPLPWQWTGDDRPMAGPLRGAAQAFAFGLAFFAVVHLLDRALFAALLRPTPVFRFHLFPYLFQAPFLVLVGWFIATSERGDREKSCAEARLKTAQWILLRAQLSPHVLFNTLNALAELARRDPEATERALLDLSELYERMLHHGDRLLAPLGEERVILERYLGLQTLRLGSKLGCQWDWDAGLDALQAPPLLLQPLVENALKHGIAAHSGGGMIRIEARREPGHLRLEVKNTGRPPDSRRREGTGLRNLEERLGQAYGGRARFQLSRKGDWTIAALELPEQPWTL